MLGKDVFAINILDPNGSSKFLPYGAHGTTTANQNLNGCGTDIGTYSGNGLSGISGAGCSEVYLYGK